MPIGDWEKNEDGTIKVRPLVDHEIGVFAQMSIVLRVRYLNPQDQLQTPTGSLVLNMTAPQAIGLIGDLMQKLEEIDTSAHPGPTS